MTVSHPPKQVPVWMKKEDTKGIPRKICTWHWGFSPTTPHKCHGGCHSIYGQGSTWTAPSGALWPKGKTGQHHGSPFLLAQLLQKVCRASYSHCNLLHTGMWSLWLFGYHRSCWCWHLTIKMLETYNRWEGHTTGEKDICGANEE